MIDLWPVVGCSFKSRGRTNGPAPPAFFAAANYYVSFAQHHVIGKEIKVFKANGLNNRYI